MEKPVVFFSHSGKDRNIILPIKNKIDDITSYTLDIFMSSDGQSIPCGSNWIAQVERGLQEAKIMFVFVTPRSLESGWIYFEAGYAYSKGIKVVPVGIGVSIGSLRPPLNLLQGFDITTGASLNNIITIINREFDCKYKELFAETDYEAIIQTQTNFATQLPSHFGAIKHTRHSHVYKDGKYVQSNMSPREWYKQFINYLNQNNIPHSSDGASIRSSGICARLSSISLPSMHLTSEKEGTKLELTLTTLFFAHAFETLIQAHKSISSDNTLWLTFALKDNHSCMTQDEDVSAIVAAYPSAFTYSDKANMLLYKSKLHFGLYHEGNYKEYFLLVHFETDKVTSNDILELIDTLIKIEAII